MPSFFELVFARAPDLLPREARRVDREYVGPRHSMTCGTALRPLLVGALCEKSYVSAVCLCVLRGSVLYVLRELNHLRRLDD